MSTNTTTMTQIPIDGEGLQGVWPDEVFVKKVRRVQKIFCT